MSDLRSKTPAGALEYCRYLTDKGYARAPQVDPWRTAIQKVFETVEGDTWESVDLTKIDLDDYFARFQTLAGAQYKAESIAAYTKRIRNAFDAHDHFIATGRPPSFRTRANRKPEPSTASAKNRVSPQKLETAPTAPAQPNSADMVDLLFPLGDGRMAKLTVPPRMSADDANRLCGLIRNLQSDDLDQRRIPAQTGPGN